MVVASGIPLAWNCEQHRNRKPALMAFTLPFGPRLTQSAEGEMVMVSKSKAQVLDPVTPGELLWEEFLVPMGLSRYRLAKEIGVPAQRIGDIVSGKRTVTAATDLRLCRFFGLSDGYWLRAQAAHDIEVAQAHMADELRRIKPWTGTAA